MALEKRSKTMDAYEWLSNFSVHRVCCEGKWYPSAEHLFQCIRLSQLAADESVVEALERILEEPKPSNARRIANEYWDNLVKVETAKISGVKSRRQAKLDAYEKQSNRDLEIMNRVVRLKIASNPELIRPLFQLDKEIILDLSKRPDGKNLSDKNNFWGVENLRDGTRKGQNHLGKIWQDVRDELREVLVI